MMEQHQAEGGCDYVVVKQNSVTAHWEGSLASPSIAVKPDNPEILIASNDMCEDSKTEVHRSEDGGLSWTQITTVDNQYWSNLFFHKGALYLLGTTKEYGDVVIRQSYDLGSTWTDPASSQTGKITSGERWHCAPTPVVEFEGRLWRCFEEFPEDGAWGISFNVGVWSAPVDSNLLDKASWTVSAPHLSFPLSTRVALKGLGWLEGNMVVDHNCTPNRLVAILRVHDFRDGLGAIVDVESKDKVDYRRVIKFPGGTKKFVIRYDERTKSYVALSNVLVTGQKLVLALSLWKASKTQGMRRRNAVALISSKDLEHWTVNKVLLYTDKKYIGFQYADFVISGEDLLAVFRSAIESEGRPPPHAMAANHMTFHRIKGFRQMLQSTVPFGTRILSSKHLKGATDGPAAP
mmetsp:Transcript_10601/g.30186  ORF Transcript_10601/g.30186 Transcript_10601/m.30186 type:complete len:405 (+) Transcript_10601:293-1507(+)